MLTFKANNPAVNHVKHWSQRLWTLRHLGWIVSMETGTVLSLTEEYHRAPYEDLCFFNSTILHRLVLFNLTIYMQMTLWFMLLINISEKMDTMSCFHQTRLTFRFSEGPRLIQGMCGEFFKRTTFRRTEWVNIHFTLPGGSSRAMSLFPNCQ